VPPRLRPLSLHRCEPPPVGTDDPVHLFPSSQLLRHLLSMEGRHACLDPEVSQPFTSAGAGERPRRVAGFRQTEPRLSMAACGPVTLDAWHCVAVSAARLAEASSARPGRLQPQCRSGVGHACGAHSCSAARPATGQNRTQQTFPVSRLAEHSPRARLVRLSLGGELTCADSPQRTPIGLCSARVFLGPQLRQ